MGTKMKKEDMEILDQTERMTFSLKVERDGHDLFNLTLIDIEEKEELH